MLQVGSIVGGKFRIDRILGQGGMGIVAVATHLQLEQTVAIKVLHDQMAQDPQTVERFLREARSSVRLRSEHVCKVSDVGQLETGEPYMVMELLEGSDLQIVGEQSRLPVETAVDYVLQACVAIAEAHALGIVHRDLKPANLFLTRRLDGSPLIKVLDFGIAKSAQTTELKMTRTATIMGSPGYMSPEQLRSSRDVDGRTDIWALGVILYELVSGRLPFHAESITELAVKVSMDPPQPLEVEPAGFRAVVMQCLEKDPANRYPTVADFASDSAAFGGEPARRTATLIASIAGNPPRTSRPVTAPHGAGLAPTKPPTTLGSAASQASVPAGPPRKRNPMLLLGAGLLLAGAAATAAVVVLKAESGPPPAPPEHPVAIAADAALALPPPPVALPDAAVATTDIADLRAKVQTFAKSRDWFAVLQLADLVKDDPESTPIVDKARHEYLAQQDRAIETAVKAGQCARARELADAAGKVVTDDTTLAAHAKACKAVAPPPPTPVTIIAAQQALAKNDFARALEIADKLVKADPSDFGAAKVAALAACGMKDAEKAKFYAAKLPPGDRQAIRKQCGDERPPPPPGDLASEVDEMEDAAKLGDYGKALSMADQILIKQPHNIAALTVAAASACHLKKGKRARMLINRLPIAKQDTPRSICQQEGVILPSPKE